MAEDVNYVDVQPAPDAKVYASTGPLVPEDSEYVEKAKGNAGAGDDNDSNPQNDKDEAKPAAQQAKTAKNDEK